MRDETFFQSNSRLRTIWLNYIDSRAVNDFDGLIDLIVADRLNVMLSDEHEFVAGHGGIETCSPVKLAELAEHYKNEIRETPVKSNVSQTRNWKGR